MFASSKNNQLLGVDIGESAIKLVQLERNGKSFLVKNVAIEPLHRGLVVERKIVDPEQIGTIIRHSIKQHKFTCKRAVVSVSVADILSKRLMIRSDLHDRELEQWIELEVDKFVPFPIADLNIDYKFIGETTGDFEREVQVIACRKQTVESQLACLEFSGLEATAVDISHYALERASKPVIESMAGGGVNDLTAIVDVGMSSLRFYVLSGNDMVYQREEPFGAGVLVEDISSEFSMPEDKAHLAIYRKQLPESYREKVLKPYVKMMLKEIERGINAFRSSGVDGQIARVLLAGGSARVGGIDNIVQKRLRLDTRSLNPLTVLRTAKKLDKDRLNSIGAQLSQACGLAMWSQDNA